MTVQSIETVKSLIDEMQANGEEVGSAWEYVNGMNNKKMFTVFTANQFCDMHCSPSVKQPKQIWGGGKFLGEYADLNHQ